MGEGVEGVVKSIKSCFTTAPVTYHELRSEVTLEELLLLSLLLPSTPYLPFPSTPLHEIPELLQTWRTSIPSLAGTALVLRVAKLTDRLQQSSSEQLQQCSANTPRNCQTPFCLSLLRVGCSRTIFSLYSTQCAIACAISSSRFGKALGPQLVSSRHLRSFPDRGRKQQIMHRHPP